MSSVINNSCSRQPVPKNGWQFFRHLAAGSLIPGPAWQNPAYRYKFVLRSLMSPFSTGQLLQNLTRQPHLMQILQVQPDLPCRLHRPWLSMNMTRRRTLKALNWHYQWLSSQLPPAVLNGYLSPPGIALATLSGKDEQTFTIRLGADDRLKKEGEATLVFCDPQQTILAEITFVLCRHQHKSTLWIGGLQGAKTHVPHQQIQQASKACHGLFPKRLLLESVMILGALFSVEQILAVSNNTHIYHSLRYRKKKQNKLYADYDSFWVSLGGERNTKGDFLLPLSIARKQEAGIASKKRAEYRRRYQLLDSLANQVTQICAPESLAP